MTALCIIPCGRKKIWDIDPDAGPVHAKNAYQGVLHKKCRTYAETKGTVWTILSAGHGFLLPDDIVPENYDAAFHHPKDQIISIAELRQQWQEKGLERTDTIIMLTGKKHEKIMAGVIPDPGKYRWETPLKGCRGIGEMLQRLNNL